MYVTQLRHCFPSGGVSLAGAERLNEDEPFKASLGVEKLPDQTSLGEWLGDIGEPGWQVMKPLVLPEAEAPKRMRTLIRHWLLIAVEWKRHARRLKACLAAPAGWVVGGGDYWRNGCHGVGC